MSNVAALPTSDGQVIKRYHCVAFKLPFHVLLESHVCATGCDLMLPDEL